MDIDHILFALGEDRAGHSGAVIPPIYQTTNFCFPDIQSMREGLAREMDAPFYTRGHNPTVATLGKKIAALAGADEALIFASGSAAIAAAVMSQVKAGDHIVCVQRPYSWTNKLLSRLLVRFGVEPTFVDGREISDWEEARRPNTKVFMLESPNSQTFELQDLRGVAAVARTNGITTVLDNSYCTMLNQPAISMGIDITVHSASKYLNGHGDVIAGVICTSRELAVQIFEGEYMTLGGIISPHDAALMLRGLRSLPLRLDHIARSTPKVVEFLENHPKVKAVYYPFGATFTQNELARRQMKQPGGQFSIEIDAPDLASCEQFCNALNRFVMACSWGGFESLIFPACVLYDSQNYGETSLPWNFIRFYIGLESPDFLIEDLRQALDQLPGS